MADRTVSVTLQAKVAGFVAGIRTAARTVDVESDRMAKKVLKNKQHLDTLGTAATRVGLVAGAGVALAIKSYADFDAAMSGVKATTHETARNMDRLRAAAIEAGKSTKFSATESANAINELAKAGVSTKDILGGGLKGALNLAAAGDLEVADAAEIAASAMVQFGLSGSKVPHIADLLSAAANKAQGSVEDMAGALKYVGPVAAGMGISIEETTGAIAELASAGVTGEQAGTSLRGMLSALTSPSKIARGEMNKLGIDVYGASGKFVGFNGVAGQLRKALHDLTPAQRDAALGTIFGNEQLTAARILYKGGSKAVDEWTRKVNDSGNASRTAATKMDNLKGDVEQLRGALETALIGTGSGGNAAVRGAVQDTTSLVNVYNDLSPATQQAVLEGTALVAVLALTAGGAAKAVVGISEARAAITALGGAAKITRFLLASGLITGVVVGGAALASYAGKASVADVSTRALAASLQRLNETNRLTGAGLQLLSGDMNPFTGEAKSAAEAFDRFGFVAKAAHSKVIPFLGGLGVAATFFANSKLDEEAHKMDGALAQLAKRDPGAAAAGFARFAGQARAAGYSMQEIRAGMPRYIAAAGGVDQITASNARTFNTAARAADGAKLSTQQLNRALHALSRGSLSTEQAEIQFEQSLHGVHASLKQNGHQLKGNSSAALQNRQALVNAAQGALSLRDAVLQQTGSNQRANAVLAVSRARLVKQVQSFGMSKAAANRYVTQILGIPKVAKTKIDLNAGGANTTLNEYLAKLNSIPKNKTTTVQFRKMAQIDSGRAAGGGHIRGGGTETSDDVPMWLSDYEYVTKAASVRKVGVPAMDYINTFGALPPPGYGGSRGYADGGVHRTTKTPREAELVVTLPYLQAQVNRPVNPLDDNAYLSSIRRQRAASKELHDQEERLYKLRHDKHATDRQIYNAEKDVKNAREALTKATKRVKDSESDLTQARKDAVSYGHDISSGITGATSVLGSGSAAGILNKLTRAGGTAGELGVGIERLRKAGVPQAILDQLLQADPAEALATVRQLLAASPAVLKQIIAAQKKLTSTASGIGAQAAYALYGVPTGRTKPKKRAHGGGVYGPGGPTDDRVPIDASNGEWVMNAAATRMIGPAQLERWNRLAPRGLVRGLALAGVGAGGGAGHTTNSIGPFHLTQTREPTVAQAQKIAREVTWGLRK